jgi:hypothetical protein
MTKSVEMEAFLENFVQKTYGRSRKGGVCVTCGSNKVAKPEHFKNNVSWEEWKISRMCQKCQDDFWESDS